MPPTLSLLMISHHRKFKAQFRSLVMAKCLAERGHRVRLIVTADSARGRLQEYDEDGVRIVEAPDLFRGQMRSGWDPWGTASRVAWLRRDTTPTDLVHCFETRPATIYPALIYSRLRRVPLMTDWNDWWGRGGILNELRPPWYANTVGWVETYYEEAFRRRGTALTVISRALKDRAVGLGVPAERIRHIPGGVRTEFFPVRSRQACRDHVGIPGSGPVLAFSSLDSHGDSEMVLKAAAIVARQYPDLKLMITGRVRGPVAEMARQHGVEGNLILPGFLPLEELPWHLGCADVFLLPFPEKVYNLGRWPNKLGDYMSLGRPTVTNDVGDVSALYARHDVGLLADWSADDFADKILRLLDDQVLADRLGANARQVAVAEYDWRVLAEKLEQFYYEVLEMSGRMGAARPRVA